MQIPPTLISFMFESQNSGGSSKNNQRSCFTFSVLFFLRVFRDAPSFPPLPFMCEPECARCQPPCQMLSAREQITLETVQDLKFYVPSPWHSSFLFNRCTLFLVIFYPSICIFIVSLLTSLCLSFSLHCNVFLHLFFHFSSYLCHYCWFPPIFCIRLLSPVTV